MTDRASPAEAVPSGRENQAPSLLDLLGAFLRMGLTAFGGPAMIPYVRGMAVGQKKWIDGESFQDGVALCQTIPGATVMQMAAYIGLKVRGVRGAMVSYVGFITPACILMLALSFAYARTRDLPAVLSVFSGLQAVVVAVVANATLSFGRTSLKHWKSALIAVIAVALFWLKVNPALIIVLAAILGMLPAGKRSTVRSASPSAAIKHTVIPLVLFFGASATGFGLLFVFGRELFQLALLMSKIDLIAFGGGFASVPLMFHEIVEVRSWMDGPTFLNGIVLGQFTPGPIVITATFVGYLAHGLAGALVATAAVFLPSFLILIGVAPWFDRIRSFPLFSMAIGGILCSFVGLLFTVTIRFALNVHWDWPHALFAVAAFGALVFKVDILWVVLAGTAISAFVF
ncbi:MAG: chromate efflux transporter [Syntrophobacteraceae bacterium]